MANSVQNNDKVPSGRYWLYIVLSVLAYIGGAFAVLIVAWYLVDAFISGEGISLTSAKAILMFWLPIVVFMVAVISAKPLTVKRQELRDLVEYDRFGNPRRKMSQMSAEERRRISEQRSAEIERVMPDSFIKSHTSKGPDDPDAELAAMTGLAPVKLAVAEMKAQMEFDMDSRKKGERERDGDACYHMCFSGPPGTGKTTCARIMASYLHKYKVIKKNFCIEVEGSDLRGGNPADTTLKCTRLLQASIGGVLFIDEAYAMMGDDRRNTDAVSTIIKFMEDYRDEFVLIIAGYSDEMASLIKSNPGFKSRIQHYIDFPSYSLPELDTIFMQMAGKEGYAVDGDAYPMFRELMERDMKDRHFGNARSVRSCLASSIRKHKANYMSGAINADKRYMLCREDITLEKGIS